MAAAAEDTPVGLARLASDPDGLAKLEKRFWGKVAFGDGCWEWKGARSDRGYGRFGIGPRDALQMLFPHRVSWWLATGRWPGQLLVCHHCDNPKCVRPDHLFLGTHGDNLRDSVAKGRRPYQKARRLAAV